MTLRVSKTNSAHQKLQLSLHTGDSLEASWVEIFTTACRESGRQPGSLRRLPSESYACWKESSPPAMALSSHHEHPVGHYPLIMSYATAVCSHGIVLGLASEPLRVSTSSYHLIHHSRMRNYQHVYTVITCVPVCYPLTGMALLLACPSQSCLHQISTRLGATPINQSDLALDKGQVKASQNHPLR